MPAYAQDGWSERSSRGASGNLLSRFILPSQRCTYTRGSGDLHHASSPFDDYSSSSVIENTPSARGSSSIGLPRLKRHGSNPSTRLSGSRCLSGIHRSTTHHPRPEGEDLFLEWCESHPSRIFKLYSHLSQITRRAIDDLGRFWDQGFGWECDCSM